MNTYWVTYKNNDGYRKLQVVANNMRTAYDRFMALWSPNEIDNGLEITKIVLEGEE